MTSVPTDHPAPTDLPDADAVQDYLTRHPPRASNRALVWLGTGALVLAMVLMAMGGNDGTALLGMMLALGVFGAIVVKGKKMREHEQRARRAQELAVSRSPRQSLDMAWRLLPGVATTPQLHVQTVALIAHSLDQLYAYDAAITAYDELIGRLPGDHPAALQFRVKRVIGQLFADRLADADDELRKLRGVVDQLKQTTIHAGYRLAELMQRVRTYHFADAIELAPGLTEDLRPLGVDAGYGHALMALAFYKVADSEKQEGLPVDPRDESLLWWRSATLLLPAPRMTERFAELSPMAHDPRMAAGANRSTPPACRPTVSMGARA